MKDIVKKLQSSFDFGVSPNEVYEAIAEITRLRARVQELEAGGEVVGVIKTYTDNGSFVPFAPFNQVYWTDGRMPEVGTKLYTAPQPAQSPISDVTEAVTKTIIEVEKALCEKLGRKWAASGISIEMLINELAERSPAADAFPQAHRLALELECLLLSCSDTVATAKWWESAHEALEEWRLFCNAM